MGNLKVEQLVLGPVSTNCYFALNQETKELLIIDPADQPERIFQKAAQMEGTPVAVLLTHGHFDHISAAEAVRDRYDIPVYACPLEGEMLREPSVNMTQYYGRPVSMKADIMPLDLEVFEVADFMVQMIFTPGHTKGSCCYYFKDENVLFSGDTLFHGSVGRTDFPGGSSAQIVESLHRLVDTLPEDTVVYPGHDMSTTIGYEKRYNPFV
nr:MBL fold metallo-hydrolase [uncultured Blautia sp.]